MQKTQNIILPKLSKIYCFSFSCVKNKNIINIIWCKGKNVLSLHLNLNKSFYESLRNCFHFESRFI